MYLLSAQVLKVGSELTSVALGSEPQEHWGEAINTVEGMGGAQRQRGLLGSVRPGARCWAPHPAATCYAGAQVSTGAREGKGGLVRVGPGCAYLRDTGLLRGARRALGDFWGPMGHRPRRNEALGPRAALHPRTGRRLRRVWGRKALCGGTSPRGARSDPALGGRV